MFIFKLKSVVIHILQAHSHQRQPPNTELIPIDSSPVNNTTILQVRQGRLGRLGRQRRRGREGARRIGRSIGPHLQNRPQNPETI